MDFRDVALEAVTEYGAMQKPRELETLLEWLAPLGLGGVLEIGGMYGGTMWCWAQVCNGPYVCVDLQVLEGRMENLLGLDYQLIVADSTDPETPKRLGEQRFDFIFIDGSHTYEDVTRDAHNWLPLLSDSGVIAFHDICHRRMRGHDMWRFWNTIVADHPDLPFYEIYDPEQAWGGIGVLSSRCLAQGLVPIEMPAQCEEWACECCGVVLNLEGGEETLCHSCAARPAVWR